jgi:carotenoid 1,2-hydratase
MWSMTERASQAISRTKDDCTIGPSSIRWTGSELVLDLNEISNPFPRRLIGQIRLIPELITTRHFVLDTQNRHAWWPIAPRARVEVELDRPGLSWEGSGYLDMNAGDEPLEDGFAKWDWSRADLKSGAAVLYDATRKDGSTRTLSLKFDKTGGVEEFEPPARQKLATTPIWRIARQTHAMDNAANIERTLEDTPFYARSLLNTKLFGENTTAMHESLSLSRFETRWVKTLLPFRMPRVAW